MSKLAAPTVAFDVNTCIGFGTPEHTHPVADLNHEWLCPTCADRLSADVAAQQPPAHRSTPTCIAGGHPAGSRWSTCLACYGD